MATTRRGVIIAALLAPFAGFGKTDGPIMISRSDRVSEDAAASFLRLEIPEYQPQRWPKVVGTADDGWAVIMDYPPLEPYDYALEVKYKNRIVRLTGDEIMNALERR